MNEPGVSFLEQNLVLLRSRYPGLAEELGLAAAAVGAKDTRKNGGKEDSPWQLEASAAGDPTLRYKGALVHSGRDPAREGERLAAASLAAGPAKNGLVFLLGFGLGYAASALARELFSRARGGTGPVLVIVERRKELFTLALETRNVEDLLAPGKAVFIIGEKSGAVTGALALLEKGGKTGLPLVVKNRSLTALTPEDESFYNEVERRIHTWASRDDINAATQKRFGKRWTRNLEANLPGIYRFPGVGYVEGLLRERAVPVFLAAAGPSLNAAEPWLEEIRRRCLVVAVDTSLRFLSDRGIAADFAVSVDPQYWNARHLHRIKPSGDPRFPGTALIAESAVYPPVLRSGDISRCTSGSGFFNRIFLCQSLFPLGRFVEDRTDPKAPLGAGGSVATTAWDFARLLGPEEIWIAGLDLAFPGYRTHYWGALFEENAHAASGRFCPAETLSVRSLESGIPFTAPAAGGGKVLTDRRLSLYGAWFENRFGQSAGTVRNRRFNLPPASGSAFSGLTGSTGLAIPGLESSGPEELLALPPRREEINALLEDLYRRLDAEFYPAEGERKGRYDKALESLVRGLEEIRGAAEDAAGTAKQGLKVTPSEKEQEKLLLKLDRVNRIIAESPVKEAAGFLFPPLAELEKDLADTPGSGESLHRHLEFSFRFYRSLAEAAAFTLDRLPSNPLP